MATITSEEREKKLTELCNDEAFLFKLAEVARLSGWSNDYHEVRAFVEECHNNGNQLVPDLDPYEIETEPEDNETIS